MVSLDLTPNQVVAICLLILVPLGMFLDGMSMLLIVVPIMFPILNQLGVDGIPLLASMRCWVLMAM